MVGDDLNFASGRRLIMLVLEDFDADPRQVRSTIPMKHVHTRTKGESQKAGRPPVKVNRLVVSEPMPAEISWGDAFACFVGAFGGIEEIERLLMSVQPKLRLIELWVPVRNSPSQENNFFDHETLNVLARLKLDLGFSFPEFL